MRALRNLILIFFFLVPAGPAAAQNITVDQTTHQLRISADFIGSEVTLFGSVIEGPGESGPPQLIVIVHGQPTPITVRQKNRVFGIWVNTRAVTYDDVPAYYFVATTDPLDSMVSSVTRRIRQIGPDEVRFHIRNAPAGATDAQLAEYRAALIRNLRNEGLFVVREGGVLLRGMNLFRTAVPIPVNAPIGRYTVETLLVRDGRIVHAQTHTMFLAKSGIERWISELAYQQPIIYGLLAVLFAMLIGWLVALGFSRFGTR